MSVGYSSDNQNICDFKDIIRRQGVLGQNYLFIRPHMMFGHNLNRWEVDMIFDFSIFASFMVRNGQNLDKICEFSPNFTISDHKSSNFWGVFYV